MSTHGEDAAVSGRRGLEIPALGRKAKLRQWAAIVGGVLVAAVLAVYFMPKKDTKEIYRVAPVTQRTIIRRIEATGHLDVRERVEVPAPVGGNIVEILAKTGEKVTRGQVLARLDSRASGLAVQSAEAALRASAAHVAQARVAANNSKEELERTRRLAQKGLASAQDLLSAQSRAGQAAAELKAALAEQSVAGGSVATARLSRNLTEIVAPGGGIVLVAPNRMGAAVTPERGPLFILGGPVEDMEIEAPVGEADIGEVRVGQKAVFEVPAFLGRVFEAHVERIGIEPVHEDHAVSYPVTLTARNPDRLLFPGMTATVRLEVATAENVIAVREAAFRFTPTDAEAVKPRSRIWKWIGRNEIEAIEVTPGTTDGAYTEVKNAQDKLHVGEQTAIGFVEAESNAPTPGISLGTKK